MGSKYGIDVLYDVWVWALGSRWYMELSIISYWSNCGGAVLVAGLLVGCGGIESMNSMEWALGRL